MYNNDQHHKMFMYAQIRPISSFLEYNTTNDEKKCKHRIAGSLAAYNKNSSEDEIANVNVLRRHRACRGQSLRPLNWVPNFYYNYASMVIYAPNHLCTYAHHTELSVCFA